MTRDPLGMVDGPNVYAYVVNNPVNYVDPLGLDLIDWLVTGTWDPDDEVAQAAYAALWGGIVDPRGCDTYIECLTKCISITAIPGISPDWEEVLVKYTVWGAITAGSARASGKLLGIYGVAIATHLEMLPLVTQGVITQAQWDATYTALLSRQAAAGFVGSAVTGIGAVALTYEVSRIATCTLRCAM